MRRNILNGGHFFLLSEEKKVDILYKQITRDEALRYMIKKRKRKKKSLQSLSY